MIFTLYTEEFFNAAHKLNNYNGKCKNLHGHTWKVCVWVKGSQDLLDETGLLWDFHNLKKLIDTFDHKFLNEMLDFNPTVENLTLYIYKKLKDESPEKSFKIRIYESIIKKESYCETGDF